MSWEWRVFVQVDGNEALVAEFLHSWGMGRLTEPERTDLYVVTESNSVGCKMRSGKKWEVKYRVGWDVATYAERYKKVKYGKKPRLATYAAEIESDLRILSIESPNVAVWSGAEKLVTMSKKRTFFSPCPDLGNVVECTLVSVVGGTLPVRWLSVSIEGKEVESLRQELISPPYNNLFSLLTASNSAVVLGGFPTFVNHLVGVKVSAEGQPVIEELATWRSSG
jgi:hypothetical protein